MKRRVCIFAAQFFPHLGGVERYTYNLSKKLIELGNEVTIVTSNTQQIKVYENIEGIEVYRMPCFRLLDGRYPVLKFNSIFKKIHSILRNKCFDLVIVNTRFYLHSIYGQWFGKTQKIKVITIDHGSSHLSVDNKILDFCGSIFEHMITKIGQIFCKEYYGVSHASVNWLKHFHITARGVLYNSVNVEEIENIRMHQKGKFRENYEIEDDAIVITFTGRLLPEKGIPQLISAFKRISQTNKKLYLFLAGDGPLESFVFKNKCRNIIPLGRLDFNNVIMLLSESDIFCLPSFSEGFSTSILEAIACRCFVVTTERGGARETFPTEEYGEVIKNNNVELLLGSLEKVIIEPERRKKAVELSFKRLIENYTWDIVASKVNKLLN